MAEPSFAAVVAALERLHEVKDRIYQDAWRRRGELIGIFANIARKYDRLEIAASERDADAVEARADTAADLCIYAVKYLTWLVEHEPEVADDFAEGDRTLWSAEQGHAAVSGVLERLVAQEQELALGPPRDLADALAALRDPFMRLEWILVDGQTVSVGEKAELVWRLADGGARYLWRLAADEPAAWAAFTAQKSNALAALTDVLVADILDAVTTRGRKAIALLGFSDLSCIVYGRLEAIGLADQVVGVFDPRRERQGGRLGLHEVAQIEAATAIDVDLLVVCEDHGKEELLRAYAAVDGRLPEVVLAGVGHFDFTDPVFTALTGKVLVKSTATGSQHTLVHLYQCLRAAATLRLTGAIAEFGMYKGGTTVMLAKMARALGVDGPVIGFDSFAGFPQRRSLFDLYADPVCEYTDIDEVRRYCEHYGVEIIGGDIVETYRRLEGEPLVLSFFDTDNYTPTKAALPLCMKQTVVGGSIVFDHFHSLDQFRYTVGERMAAAELLLDSDFFHLHGTGVFTRLR